MRTTQPLIKPGAAQASPNGAIEQVATWPRLGVNVQYFLSVDHDGAPLISLARPGGFVVVRVETLAGCADIAAVHKENSALLLGPTIVSPVGYTFFVNDNGVGRTIRT